MNHAELTEKSQPVCHIPMFGDFAIFNPEYIHGIKMQFSAMRRDVKPIAAAVCPGDGTVGYHYVLFGYQPVNMISKIRYGFKGLREKIHKPGFALRGNIIVLNIVIQHNLIQNAQIMIDENAVDQSFNDDFVTNRQL